MSKHRMDHVLITFRNIKNGAVLDFSESSVNAQQLREITGYDVSKIVGVGVNTDELQGDHPGYNLALRGATEFCHDGMPARLRHITVDGRGTMNEPHIVVPRGGVKLQEHTEHVFRINGDEMMKKKQLESIDENIVELHVPVSKGGRIVKHRLMGLPTTHFVFQWVKQEMARNKNPDTTPSMHTNFIEAIRVGEHPTLGVQLMQWEQGETLRKLIRSEIGNPVPLQIIVENPSLPPGEPLGDLVLHFYFESRIREDHPHAPQQSATEVVEKIVRDGPLGQDTDDALADPTTLNGVDQNTLEDARVTVGGTRGRRD